jgi:hypothetical protein
VRRLRGPADAGSDRDPIAGRPLDRRRAVAYFVAGTTLGGTRCQGPRAIHGDGLLCQQPGVNRLEVVVLDHVAAGKRVALGPGDVVDQQVSMGSRAEHIVGAVPD